MSWLGWVGAAGVALLLSLALLGDAATGHGFAEQDPEHSLEGLSAAHPLGTDALGRDLLARVAEGARVSLLVAVGSSALALLIGVAYGALAGYLGGRVDSALMRIVDGLYALPDILLIVLLGELLAPLLAGAPELYRRLLALLLALGLLGWVGIARLTRGLVLQAREEAWVEAARALGARGVRVLVRHILPHVSGPLLVTATFRVPAAILTESTVSFIGLGVQPPFASWGVLASDGFSALRSYPHLMLGPGLAILATLLCFHLLGQALEDALDPRRVAAGRSPR